MKDSSSTFADMNINKTKLLANIKDIKSFLNLLCFDNLFKIESIIYNIGFYIITFIKIFHIINAFIFFLKKFRLIKCKITNIISGIKNYKSTKPDKARKRNRLITRGNIIKSDNNSNNEMISLSKKNKKKNKRKKGKKNNKELEIKEIPNININKKNYNNIIIDNDNKKKKKKKNLKKYKK